MVAEARRLATQVPINDKRASEKEVSGAFRSKSGVKAQLERCGRILSEQIMRMRRS